MHHAKQTRFKILSFNMMEGFIVAETNTTKFKVQIDRGPKKLIIPMFDSLFFGVTAKLIFLFVKRAENPIRYINERITA
jgi:hypothetical protein